MYESHSMNKGGFLNEEGPFIFIRVNKFNK